MLQFYTIHTKILLQDFYYSYLILLNIFESLQLCFYFQILNVVLQVSTSLYSQTALFNNEYNINYMLESKIVKYTTLFLTTVGSRSTISEGFLTTNRITPYTIVKPMTVTNMNLFLVYDTKLTYNIFKNLYYLFYHSGLHFAKCYFIATNTILEEMLAVNFFFLRQAMSTELKQLLFTSNCMTQLCTLVNFIKKYPLDFLFVLNAQVQLKVLRDIRWCNTNIVGICIDAYTIGDFDIAIPFDTQSADSHFFFLEFCTVTLAQSHYELNYNFVKKQQHFIEKLLEL